VAIGQSRRIKFVSLVAAMLGIAACVVPTVANEAFAAPPAPKPTLAQVQQELSTLMRKNSQLVDAYNRAQADVTAKQKAAKADQLAAQQADAAFEQAREALSATVAAQYESGSFSAAGALLTSQNGASYLDELNTLNMISEHNAGVAAQLDAARRAANTATEQAKAAVAAAQQRMADVVKQKSDLDAQFAKYTNLLHTLTAAQQTAFTNPMSAQVTAASQALMQASVALANIPGAAKKAVDFAIHQVGKPYVYGAAGPGAYDCSGLTMAAYASAGIALPHSAAGQYDVTQHIPFSSVSDLISKLQPGDEVFYYSPIGHVVIYVGNGQAISASTEGVPIGYIDLNNWDASQITGASRVAVS
jgi:cell wall-associated NlpC family hydrolase